MGCLPKQNQYLIITHHGSNQITLIAEIKLLLAHPFIDNNGIVSYFIQLIKGNFYLKELQFNAFLMYFDWSYIINYLKWQMAIQECDGKKIRKTEK